MANITSTQFTEYTYRILEKLPYWFKMKKNPGESLGAKFLNTVGIELQDMKAILDYALNQQYLQTADVGCVDIVYKTSLPQGITSTSDVQVSTDSLELKKVLTSKSFLISSSKVLNFPELYCEDPYYIDFNKSILYVKKPYDTNYRYPYGKVYLKANDINYELKLNLHSVWNFFDEFGMLLCCPRLFGERNAEYKERILDVFKNPANASRQGLANGIARELNLRRELTWEDGSKDIIIEEAMVIVNEIHVDGINLSPSLIFKNNANQIVLKGNDAYKGVTRKISYIAGIEMHRLHNRDDITLNKQLFNVDNTATNLLQYYAERIKSQVPIMWNQFKWNDGYWDVADKQASGCASIPSIHDSDISGLMWYEKDKVQNIYTYKEPTLTDLYVDPAKTGLYIDRENESSVIYDKPLMSLLTAPDKITIKEGDILGLTFDRENE